MSKTKKKNGSCLGYLFVIGLIVGIIEIGIEYLVKYWKIWLPIVIAILLIYAFAISYKIEKRKAYANNNVLNSAQKLSNNTFQEKQIVNSFVNTNIDTMDGHDFEYFCAEILRTIGYVNVRVTTASGDHGIDILAELNGEKYAVQCKCYSSNIGNKAVQEAFSGSNYYGCNHPVVLTNRYFTPQAKDEAQHLGVELWDRNVLIKMINQTVKTDNFTNNNSVYTNNNMRQVPINKENNEMHNIDIDGITIYSFENLCTEVLKSIGCFVITNPNKELGFNMIAEYREMIFWVYCIYDIMYLDENMVSEIYMRSYKDNRPSIIFTRGYFTREAIVRAEENNVILCDRNDLLNMINGDSKELISKNHFTL